MLVYKIVKRLENGELVSAFISGEASVKYLSGKYVRAPQWLEKRGYYITAFKQFWHALAYFCFQSNLEIWVARTPKIIEEKRLPCPCDIEKLSYGQYCRSWLYWPQGTVMCRKIKLLRRIY